jgi:hypothetical protein
MRTKDLFNAVYKTGMRVPVNGIYEDQFGMQTSHSVHRTFPPCVYHKGEAALRRLVSVAKTV